MAAYLIAGNDVTDKDSMEQYVAAAGATLGPYGAELLAPGPDALALGGKVVYKEGDFRPSRVVVIKFPDMEQALAWYESPEYQSIIGLRLAGSRGSLFFAEGL